MYELVLKDFRLNKKMYLVNALWVPVYAGILLAIGYPDALMALPVVGIGIPITNLFSLDENGYSNTLFASLPYRRPSLVKARYITVWLIFITFMLFVFVLKMVFGFWQPVFGTVIDQLPMDLVMFNVFSLMILIAIPFMIRYGKGGFFIGLFVFSIISGILIAISSWVNIFEMLRQLLNPESWSVALQTGLKISFTFLMLSVMTGISYLISARIFEKKDLG